MLVSQETLTKKPFRRNNYTLIGAVMKRAALAITLVFSLLVSLMVGVQPLVKANPYYDVAPTIGILSPYPSGECCYSNASVPLKIGILVLENRYGGAFTPQVFYSLDNGDNITLTDLKEGEHWAKVSWLQSTVSFTVSSTLYNLTEGNHTLSAYAISDGKVLSAERVFTVDSSYKSPELTLISPKKITYTTSEVPLIFSTSKEFKSAKYLLDYHLNSQGSRGYISIDGNITLTNLADGIHKIILLAECFDKYYSGSLYQGTSFNVSINGNTTLTGLTEYADATLDSSTEPTQSPEPQPEPFSTTLVFASVSIVAILCIGLFVYFKKRKH